jgi:hypothetical protein
MTTYSIELGSAEQAQQVERMLNADVEGGVYAEVDGSEVLLTVSPIVAAIGGVVSAVSLAVIRLYDWLSTEQGGYRSRPSV